MQTYTDNPGEDWMRAEASRIQGLADFLDIPVRVGAAGNELSLEFENWHDCAEIRLNAFGDTFDPNGHTHTETFKRVDPAFKTAWAVAARRELDERSVEFRLEENGEKLDFVFDRLSDHAIFITLRDQKIFLEAAMTAVQQQHSERSEHQEILREDQRDQNKVNLHEAREIAEAAIGRRAAWIRSPGHHHEHER